MQIEAKLASCIMGFGSQWTTTKWDKICMCAEKSYSVSLSVIYKQSCKIALVESESDNLKGCVLDNAVFFYWGVHFFPAWVN